MASKVTLTINLGNDAMQTLTDISRALRECAQDLSRECSGTSLTEGEGRKFKRTSTIRDTNGNSVGKLVIK